MIAIFLGPPGSGKGTQAAMLAERFNLNHFDMGRALRDEIASGSELSSKIRQYTDAGELVPISVIKIIVEKIIQKQGDAGIILDGFPRSEEQANLLDEVLSDSGQKLDNAFYFNLDDSVIVERIVNRRFCPVCKSVYNIISAPPKSEGTCDRDGALLAVRPDDNEIVVKNRLEVYHRETEPILRRYREAGLLCEIDASCDIADISMHLERMLRFQ